MAVDGGGGEAAALERAREIVALAPGLEEDQRLSIFLLDLGHELEKFLFLVRGALADLHNLR